MFTRKDDRSRPADSRRTMPTPGPSAAADSRRPVSTPDRTAPADSRRPVSTPAPDPTAPAESRRRPALGGSPRPAAPRRRPWSWPRAALSCAVAVACLGGAAIAAAMAALPPLGDPAATLPHTSVLYDASGRVAATVPGPTLRLPVPLSEVPAVVQNAFVATEDRHFYHEGGISLRGIARAAVADLRGAPLQGGSTITQQLARNLYLTPRATLTRKVREAILAVELAHRYRKAQILDMYLNEVFLGERAYGVQAAAEAYFSQPVGALTLPQAALLAGLPQAPSAYDPLLHPNAARTRRNLVLQRMAEQGYITAAQARSAAAAPLGLAPGGSPASGAPPASPPAPSPGSPSPGSPTAASALAYNYPWFVDAVVTQLEGTYGLSPQQVTAGGLRIYTTLNPRVYDAAQQAVTAELDSAYPTAPGDTNPMQAAAVILDQHNGDVLAVIGGRTHDAVRGFDRATQALQQPGSAIKPLLDYIPALQAGYTAGTVLNDVATGFHVGPGQPLYLPTNYDHLYYGLTTLTEALRRSVNVVAVQLLDRVGVAQGVATARRLGLTDLNPATNDHLAVALGATVGCCTPLQMADAYATIANGGALVTPRLITRVVAPDGRVLVDNRVRSHQVLDARIAYVMTKMLQTVDTPQPNTGWDVLSGPHDSNYGTGYDAQVQDNVPGWPMAAKSGTTSGNRQAWYVAYTPLYTGAVWVGRDTPQTEPGLFGGVQAGPILQAAMMAALAGRQPVDFARPGGIVAAPIDIRAAPWHVAKPGPLTPAQDTRQEWFVAGTQPTEVSSLRVQRVVGDSNDGALWQAGCPGSPVTETYLNLPGAYGPAWAQQIAADVGTSNWQQFIPLDAGLAAPTATCRPQGLWGVLRGLIGGPAPQAGAPINPPF